MSKPVYINQLLREHNPSAPTFLERILYYDCTYSERIGNLNFTIEVIDEKEMPVKVSEAKGSIKATGRSGLGHQKRQGVFDLKALILPNLDKAIKPPQEDKKSKSKSDKKPKEEKKKKEQKKDKKDKKQQKTGGPKTKAKGGRGKQDKKKKKADELDEDDLDTLSFNKLQKMIVENHPCDPATKERFKVGSRVTVRNINKKLFDVCCILKIIKFQKALMNKIKNCLLNTICKCCKKKRFRWPKPKSMEKIPDSDSESGEEQTNIKNELTLCGQSLGEGTVLYLQMMRTFAILFFILTVLNGPLYYAYNSSSSNNNLSLNEIWKYFTVGNIGNTDNACSWSSLDLKVLDNDIENIQFQCAEGHYINELKQFGFFWKTDLRFNIDSEGESFCKKAEFPNAGALYLGQTKLGEPPIPQCEDGQRPSTDDCLPASDLVPGGGMKRQLKINNEIPDILKDYVHIIEEDEEELQDEQFTNTNQRRLATADPPETQECFDCFKSQSRYCQDSKFESGQCCNPSTQNCTNEELPLFCKSEESFEFSSLFDSAVSDKFYRALCPEDAHCHQWANKKIVMIDGQETKFDLMEELYDLENDKAQTCSYFVKTPMLSEDNDQINVKIKNIGNNNITIMIVQENKYGEIEYIPEMVFNPTINNKFYNFQLHKLQNDLNELERPSRYYDDPESEHRLRRNQSDYDAEMEIYNQEKSMALREGFQTQYSIIVHVEGTEALKQELQQEDYEFDQPLQIVLKETPGTKYYSANELESELERDDRYSFEFWPVYDRIKAIGEQPDASEIPDEHVQEATPYNIDPHCQFHNEWDEETSIFQTQEYNDFFSAMIQHTCFNQSECEISLSWFIQDPETFDYENLDQPLNILNKLSDNCIQRIRYQEITSPQFLMILGCQNDYIESSAGKFHKDNFGIWLVATDIMCICVITYFFGKIKELNNEYIEIIDNLSITMSDYSLQICNLKVDKFSQDPRILHMKLWIYINNILKPKREPGNKMDVIDINLSIFNLPHVKCIMKLQEIQQEINAKKNNILAGQFEDPESEDLEKRKIAKLQDKFDREKIIYLELTDKNVDRSRQIMKKTPKEMKVRDIVYVYVIFKHCNTIEECLEEFKYDLPLQDFVKQVLGIGVKDIHRKQFQYNNIICERSQEPDEIIWENLIYSFTNQKRRALFAKVVSSLFVIAIIIYEMYTGILSDLITNVIKSPDCPEFYSAYDLTTKYSRRIALEDYLKPAEQQLGLMECYCSLQTQVEMPWTLFIDTFEYEDRSTHYICLQMHTLWVCKQLMGMVIDIGVVFINGMIAILIEILEDFTKHHSRRSQQISAFRQIFILEFLNMGAIQILSSQSLFQDVNEGILSVVGETGSETYTGFTPAWYMDTGLQVCLFLFTSSFVSNIGNWKNYLKVEFKRWKDRTFSLRLKQDPDDPDDDQPNTRLMLQSELEALYTGAEFDGEGAYSRMMSTMFALLLFSSGMPVLYFIGFLFFTGTYITNKVIILRFYTKSQTLTRTIPQFAEQVLMTSIYLHIILAGFMFTNKQVFLTRERPLETIEFDMRSELEKDVIQEDEEDSGYQYYASRFYLLHQQVYVSFVLGFFLSLWAGNCFIQILTMWFRCVMFILEKIYECLKAFFMDIFKCAKKAIKREQSDSSSDSQANKGYESYESSRLSTEQDTIKDYKDTDQEEELGDSRRSQQVLNILKAALLQKVEDEKQRIILSDRAKRRQQRTERKAAILKAREDEFWRKMEQKKTRADYSENICDELNVNYLQKFYQRSKKEFGDYLDLFNLSPGSTITDDLMDPNNTSKKSQLFQEVCYVSRITAWEAINFQKILNRRNKQIEHRIDSHYKLITKDLISKKQAEFEKVMEKKRKSGKLMSLFQQHQLIDEQNKELEEMKAEFTDIRVIPYDRKCQDLLKNQEELIAADKARKENRQGIQEICRMAGSKSQSFFIFDQPQNAVGRKIYFGIEEEEALEFVEKDKEESENDSNKSQSGSETDDRSMTMSTSKKSSKSTKKSQKDKGSGGRSSKSNKVGAGK